MRRSSSPTCARSLNTPSSPQAEFFYAESVGEHLEGLPFRSFVTASMRHDRLLLAGENAHTVPPTGAKSLNLALADVRVLHEAIVGYLDDGRDEVLDRYTERAGAGVDGAALFVLDDDDVAHPGERLASDRQRQRAELAMIPQMAGTADVVAGAITIADLNDLRWSPTYPRQKSHHRVSHRVKLVRSDLRTHIR